MEAIDLLFFKKKSYLLKIATHLSLLLGQLHVIEDPEDDSEQVLPPVLLESVPVRLHHLKHDGQPPKTKTSGAIDREELMAAFPALFSRLLFEVAPTDLVRTSNLHLLMMQDNSKRMGNQPRTHTRSSGATFMSSLV